MAGTLSAGDALPSMRLLAKELRISVITTKRAYEELERDGFLENVPGKGCFVAPQNRELLRETQRIELENGRERTIHWGPRTLDIDLILYGTVTLCDERLTLPHPEYLKRAFVLVPLAEVLRPNDPHAAHIRAALDGMPTDGITPVMAW